MLIKVIFGPNDPMFRVVWKYLRVAIGKNVSFNVMNVIVTIMLLLGQNNFWQIWRPFSHYNVIAIKSKMQSKSPPYRCLDATVMNVFIGSLFTLNTSFNTRILISL